jgi:CHAP domain/Putative peptidoglycan binding domain
MATARSIIKRAMVEVGNGERPPGSNKTKYGDWYGMDGQPWCAMFQSWLFAKEGMPEIKFAYTPSFAQFFVDAGRWHEKSPQPGDVVFFNFPDSLDRIQHVGLVVDTNSDGSITTIEGNTSSGESGSQDNGEGVFRRVRKSFIVGYGSPSFNNKPSQQQKPRVKLWFGKGDKGADVRRWQIHLQKLISPDPALLIDGEFGRNTLAATLLFQEKFQQDVDGRVGAASLRAMEEAIRALKRD